MVRAGSEWDIVGGEECTLGKERVYVMISYGKWDQVDAKEVVVGNHYDMNEAIIN